MSKILSETQLSSTYRWACMAELQALKPGNVHMFADGHGMTVDDFIKSADVTAPLIAQSNLSVGKRIYLAVEATQNAVALNTNLGLILLCAPLIHTSLRADVNLSLAQNLQITLNQLNIDDARLAAEAILLAKPAGLGNALVHDVHGVVEVNLLDLMAAAQNHDRVAWQYANAYVDILEFGLTHYKTAMERWENQAWATCSLYLSFLAYQPDSHITRKYGAAIAEEVTAEAKRLDEEFKGSINPKLVQKKLLNWDVSLKRRHINPGTSADLTVASLLASCLV